MEFLRGRESNDFGDKRIFGWRRIGSGGGDLFEELGHIKKAGEAINFE